MNDCKGPLAATGETVRAEWHLKYGKCLLCQMGNRPVGGLHDGEYDCGNNHTCNLCHNAGMKYGDRCMACGRICMEDGE